MPKLIDISGQKIGFYSVHEYAGNQKYRCVCDCGTVRFLRRNDLWARTNPSCGCQKYKALAIAKTKHGMTGTREYKCWLNMKRRCYEKTNNRYHVYGALGIKVCPEWKDDFAQFYKDMGPAPTPSHTIDRIDVRGNYEPGNVRWADPETQANNKRSNTFLAYNGKILTITQWERLLGFNTGTVRARINKGWSIDSALSTPIIVPVRKLSDDDVLFIIRSTKTHKELAGEFGISASLVRKMKAGIEGYREFYAIP